MFYFVTSIIIGVILVLSSGYLYLKNKKDLLVNLIYLFAGIGFIVVDVLVF